MERRAWEGLEKWLAGLLFLASLIVVISALSNYKFNWMHPEIFAAEQKHILGLTALHWRDVARFFDCDDIADTCTRARFLSYLIGYLNSFFRLWLVRYIPPHPSLSLNWIVSFASLYFFYRTIALLTGDRTAAFLAAGLYALSAGFLSMMLMLFNPAKPLARFFVNFSLYLAARIWRAPDGKAASPIAIVLFIALFLAYTSDETTWILSGAILILFPDFLQRRHRRFLFCLLATFPIFLAAVTWVAPAAIAYFWGYQDFNFWGWALNLGRQAEPDQPTLIERLSAREIWLHAYAMAESQYAWWRSGPVIAAVSLLPVAGGVVATAWMANREPRALLVRATVLLVAFVLFQDVLMLRHFIESGTYYYSALFSNFSLLVVGVAVSCVRGVRAARVVCFFAALYLGYVSYSWTMAFNRGWMVIHDDIYREVIGDRYGPLSPGASLNEAKVANYWRAVRANQDVRDAQTAFAPRDVWLFEEMASWRRR